MDFHIEDEAIDDATHVITLSGEVDSYTALEFKERLVELVAAGGKHIIVDLSDATLLEDSSVLRIVRAQTAPLESAGGSIALVLSEEERRTYEMAGFDRLYRIYGSRNEAWAAASGGGEPDESQAIDALTHVIDLVPRWTVRAQRD